MTLAELQWREPLWLLLALYPLAAIFVNILVRRLRADHYSDSHLLPWVMLGPSRSIQFERLRHVTYMLAWCCFAISMAGPRSAEKVYRNDQGDFTQVMIVLDVSHSMTARDLLPSRLQRARLEILDFLQYSDQLSVGLTVFAARPHLLSPMTHDKSAVRHYLDSLQVPLLPTAGSNINDALLFAARAMGPTNGQQRAILLITDGDSETFRQPQPQQQVARQLIQQEISVYVLGMATRTGQAVVSQLDPRYQRASTTITRLQRAPLTQLAQLTHSAYSDVRDNDSDWQQLYDDGIAHLIPSAHDSQSAQHKVIWHEHFALPLIIGLMLFTASFLKPSSRNKNALLSHTAVLLISLGMATIYQPVMAESIDYQHAYELYQRSEYKQAASSFALLAGFLARLGEASSYYLQGDFNRAQTTYTQAMLIATTDQQRATALFNLANTYFQLKDFSYAAQLYRDVLRYDPKHPAAGDNLRHAEYEQRQQAAGTNPVVRTGRGPRMGRAADNIDLSNTQVSLAESENDQQPLLPNNPTSPKTTTRALSETQLASEKIERTEDRQWSYRLTSLPELQARLQGMQGEPGYIWQRMFELEEGFPAPVSRPHPLPGGSPW